MKTCKCEHWQTCPTCYPQGFDVEGNRLPPAPTPLQSARENAMRWHDEAQTAWAQAHRLALELEAVIMSCQDQAAVAKWWDSAHEALQEWDDLSKVEPPERPIHTSPKTSKDAERYRWLRDNTTDRNGLVITDAAIDAAISKEVNHGLG